MVLGDIAEALLPITAKAEHRHARRLEVGNVIEPV